MADQSNEFETVSNFASNTPHKKSPSFYKMLRMDMPTAHTKYSYSHLNINHRVSNLPDPNIRLPRDGLTVSAMCICSFDAL
jgi:hypothetical protein